MRPGGLMQDWYHRPGPRPHPKEPTKTNAHAEFPAHDEDRYPTAQCRTCSQHVLIKADGTLTRHGNVTTGECPTTI